MAGRGALSMFDVIVASVLVAVIGLVAVTAQAQSDLSGVWQIMLDTQTGEQVWTAAFEQSGSTLGGEIDMNDGEGTLPIEGSVDGNMIKWGFVVPDLDGDMPINLSGEVQGATIKGDEGSFVWYGTGVWTGAKQ